MAWQRNCIYNVNFYCVFYGMLLYAEMCVWNEIFLGNWVLAFFWKRQLWNVAKFPVNVAQVWFEMHFESFL